MVWLFVCRCLCVSNIGNSAVSSCFKGVREWCGCLCVGACVSPTLVTAP